MSSLFIILSWCSCRFFALQSDWWAEVPPAAQPGCWHLLDFRPWQLWEHVWWYRGSEGGDHLYCWPARWHLSSSLQVCGVPLQRSRYTPGPLNLPQSTLGQASRFVCISVNRLKGQEIKTEASVSLACQLDTWFSGKLIPKLKYTLAKNPKFSFFWSEW